MTFATKTWHLQNAGFSSGFWTYRRANEVDCTHHDTGVGIYLLFHKISSFHLISKFFICFIFNFFLCSLSFCFSISFSFPLSFSFSFSFFFSFLFPFFFLFLFLFPFLFLFLLLFLFTFNFLFFIFCFFFFFRRCSTSVSCYPKLPHDFQMEFPG